MSGAIYTASHRRTFVFSGAGQQIVDDRIDVSSFREGTLLVRVHGTPSGGGTMVANVRAVSISADDPQDFIYGTIVASTTSIVSGTNGGTLLLAGFNAPFGTHVRITLDVTVASLTAILSIDLSLKN